MVGLVLVSCARLIMVNPCRKLTFPARNSRWLLLLGLSVLHAAVAASQTPPTSLQQAVELEAQAGRLAKEGQFADAISSARKALAIREAALGRDDASIAATLVGIGELHYRLAQWKEAAECFDRALAIRERALGVDNLATADAANNLGLTRLRQGDVVGAEQLLTRVLEIRRKQLGPDDPSVASAMNSLTEVYLRRGDVGRALPLAETAVAVQEKAAAKEERPGAETITLAAFLNQLGRVHVAKEDLHAAEAPFKRSLELRERSLKPDDQSIAIALTALATLYQARGELGRAEPLYARSLGIYEARFGADSLNLAPTINSLAVLYLLKGDMERARPLYLRALDIRERNLGPRHPDVATALASIAVFYQLGGEPRKAIEAQRRSVEIRDQNASIILATGSEQQKLQYMDTLQESTDITLSLRREFGADPDAVSMAATTVLRRKGRVLDAMVDSTANLRRRLDADGRALLDRLSAARAQLARVAFQAPAANAREGQKQAVSAAENEVQRLETALSQTSGAASGDMRTTNLTDVQQAIPPGALLVEYVKYRPFDPRATKLLERFGAARFAAFVLGRDGPPKWIELGPAEPIESGVAAWRSALRNPSRTDVDTLGRAVDELIMRPVRSASAQAGQLLISPDGNLNLIPFAALVDEHRRHLLQRYDITYLSSGRDLLRLRDTRPARQQALVIADPAFEAPANESAAGSKQPAEPGMRFDRLPGTAEEARTIAKLLRGSEVRMGADATEGAVKAAQGPAVLHIASHGFFFNPASLQAGAGADARGVTPIGGGAAPEAALQYPLLRSGIALAGANQRRGGGSEDGLLLAIEAASLDLDGTRLVVLSACETGVGDVKSGDGVHGLRRALSMAGAETVAMSLWPVSDEATTDLMVGFYERLLAGRGRAASLRDVQLEMSKRGRRTHPFYWAGFVVAGKWTALAATFGGA
jgi:CHAT domain-containing protein/Tfp pilus assembly protein PilF